MLIVFALSAALLYGSADFLGGAASRRAALLAVLLTGGLAGLAVQVPVVLAAGGPPRAAGIEWGLAAGAVGGAGLALFYAGLAAGPMSVVSPVAALASTLLPVGVALGEGEHLTAGVAAGAGLCLAATVLVSAAARPKAGDGSGGDAVPRWRHRAKGLACGLASGAAFGLFFLFIRNGGESGALWPALASRSAGLAIYAAVALPRRTGPVLWTSGRGAFAAAVGSGALDAAANVCYVLSTRAGLLGPAVVLTALYPGVTVLLARLVLRERLHPRQQAGLVLAAAGIALITA